MTLDSPVEDTAPFEAFDDVVVVIPAWNEAQVMGQVVKTVMTRFRHVLVIDDGSTDRTGELATTAGAHVATHTLNLGQGGALATGLRVATRLPDVRWIVTFDADGQHQVEDAVRLVERARQDDCDVVLGTRFKGGSSNIHWHRRWLLKAATAYTRRSTGLDVSDTHNGLRVFSSDFAARLSLRDCGMGHASEILDQVADLDARWAEVPVDIKYTEYSESKGQPLSNSVNILFDRMLR